VGLYIMSPATSTNTDAVIKYLDWMAQEDVAWTMNFGIEGEHYEMQDGAPLPIDPEYNRQTMGYIMGDLKLVFNGPPATISSDIIDAITRANNPVLGDEMIAAQEIAARDGFHEIVFNEELAEWSKYGPEIVKAADEYWVRMVMADDFDSAYSAFMEQLEARNIEEVVAEREAYFDRYFGN
jgi:putative aldouronate transport system substrate-binding protein